MENHQSIEFDTRPEQQPILSSFREPNVLGPQPFKEGNQTMSEPIDVIQAILNRKSVRYFKPYTMPQEDVQLLLECARFAPSGGNRQPWEFLVVDNPEDIAAIYDFGWTVYGGGTNVCRFGEASLLVFFLGSAQVFLAAENLALAAYGLGYGSCMIGAFDQEKTRALLGIPQEKRVSLFVVVGVADEERSNEARFTSTGELVSAALPQPPEARKSLDEIAPSRPVWNPFCRRRAGKDAPANCGRVQELDHGLKARTEEGMPGWRT